MVIRTRDTWLTRPVFSRLSRLSYDVGGLGQVRTLLCTAEARLVAELLRRAEAVDAAYEPDRSGDELREDACRVLPGHLGCHFSAEEARGQLAILVSWGRYAEAFAYDEASESLYLE